ncbi:MAG: hypothetical protein US60_C0002G0038 [Microgenomates group bacterium GW2011_GWC1_37_8]|uniref:Uncharacterized protein n=1 Tax=Candidatus Woesebacteria bacterium GW2011_GWB1_38_8 TaxID=1618570 RepID=A0A0G0P820_9BACT|nr:MAG: hypothetical protein US60_C0002G0038 [Microgenomates group bacterium GW2011_GWC1_37_8]KKQ85476.1 MAG: hypothetical protein UT08_C0006G0059 [Candidatus Woesebacteria bacterium GW2011_GWB1_38_8]
MSTFTVVVVWLLTNVLTYIGGIFTAFGKGWVDDKFKKIAEDRADLRSSKKLISRIIAEGVTHGFKFKPSESVTLNGFNVAMQVETMGQKELAFKFRSFLNLWGLLPAMKIYDTLEDHKEHTKDVRKLDNLANEIVEMLQKI